MLLVPVLQAMQEVLERNDRVICSYARRGKARALRCRDCAKEFPCSSCGGRFTVYETTIRCHHCGVVEPVPLSCPSCGGQRLTEEGYGNRAIKSILEQQCAGKRVSVIEQGMVEDLEADILLVTPHYLESIYDPRDRPMRVSLVVELDADAALYDRQFRSFELMVRHLEELRGLSQRLGAVCLAQTFAPEVYASFEKDPMEFYARELELRRAYRLPPFTRRMRLQVRGKDEHHNRLAYEHIRQHLAGMPGVAVTVPKSRTTKNQGLMEASVEPTSVPAVLSFFGTLPDHVMIDASAGS